MNACIPIHALRALVLVIACTLTATMPRAAEAEEATRPPNIVLIFADDMGYADVGCFGAEGIETPHLDQMAAEGMRFTDFYVPQAVCSASRAGIMTGCYPNRVGILGALGPHAKTGIAAEEVIIPEVLKPLGYAAAVYGKWHLGDHHEFLPTDNGFDDYFGLPCSNDMWPKHPSNKNFPDLELFDGKRIVEHNPDQSRLTTWYTERAVKFIHEQKDRPFFLYVPHSMPHVPLYVSDKFKGKSARGLYGDVIMEIDWSVGQILAALKENGLDDNTLVVFTSDNGPWLSYGDHAGSAGPLREGKGTTFEGGVRVPAIFRFPGHIPAGKVCREPAMTIDLLPTFARLAGAEPPADRIIDGRDIWPLLSGDPGAKSPHEALYFYCERHLQAVRSGDWKLHFPHDYRTLKPDADGVRKGGTGGLPAEYEQASIGLSLFNLKNDPGETTDVAAEHPDVVDRLKRLADQAREDLGDSATNTSGKNLRAAGSRS